MKHHDLASFKKALSASPALCLVLGKEPQEAISCVLKSWGARALTLEAEAFTSKRFLEEVETLPFLAERAYLHISDIQRLEQKDLEVLAAFAVRPSSWVSLLLSGTSLHPQSKVAKLFDQHGCVLRLAEEKPWEKERLAAAWLMQVAIEEGCAIERGAAERLVRGIGPEKTLLRQELVKLICFVGAKKQIVEADVRALSYHLPHETLFQLTDALFKRHTLEALSIGRSLALEGGGVFPLMAGLRTQMRTGMQMLLLLQRGGAPSVTEAFPYLKGGFLEKKLQMLQSYGLEALQKAISQIFETELLMKNSSADPTLLFETLLIKLAYAFPTS